jgi:hypothetical protein
MKTVIQELVELEQDLTRMFDSDIRVGLALLEFIRTNKNKLKKNYEEDKGRKSNNANTLLSAVIVHPHPIVELRLEKIKEDESGKYTELVIYNTVSKEVESSFFLTIELAEEIINQLKDFINNCR